MRSVTSRALRVLPSSLQLSCPPVSPGRGIPPCLRNTPGHSHHRRIGQLRLTDHLLEVLSQTEERRLHHTKGAQVAERTGGKGDTVSVQTTAEEPSRG